MGSKNKYFGVESADHGFDDIGVAQPSGSFSGATLATKWGPRFAGKTQIVLGTTAGLLRTGQSLNLTSTDGYLTAQTRILKVLPGATQVIVNRTWQTPTAGTSGTGTYNVLGGEGAWDGFMPIGGNVTGANLTLTFWEPNQQGSDENAVDYFEGKKYYFPGTIKTALIASSGNIRLFRSASLRPRGATAQ